MTQAADAGARGPVLRTPYEAPTDHWRLDARGRTLDIRDPGRRPSLPRIEVPGPGPTSKLRSSRQTLLPLAAETDRVDADPAARVEPHRTINELPGRLVLTERGRGCAGNRLTDRARLRLAADPMREREWDALIGATRDAERAWRDVERWAKRLDEPLPAEPDRRTAWVNAVDGWMRGFRAAVEAEWNDPEAAETLSS